MSDPMLALKNTSPARWQECLRDAFRTLPELLAFVEVDPANAGGFQPRADEFEMLVPRSFAGRMRKGDPMDPLLRQVLPHLSERLDVNGFEDDPLRETRDVRDGVLSKYGGRALLVSTGACPVHCRYCFRRHFPYAEQLASRTRWRPATAELRRMSNLTEVILSGGDPLSLSNDRLAELIAELTQLDSVDTLRIHTRFPIIVPERVDPGLLNLLAQSPLNTVVVVHCNHANEIDLTVANALGALRSTNSVLLNQSVLLRGVNDTAAALDALSRRLFECGVLPYYLHLLDPVRGAAHFDVGAAEGRALIERLRAHLPGYLVPRLAREDPGASSKTIVA